MGEVYRAHDPRLGRDVALKLVPESMAADAEALARFTREARTVAALNHPHIVTIYSTEEAAGVRFMTMELIEGQTLDRVIPEGGVSLPQFLDVSTALADALSAAHQKQILHRDLKPANVMVTHSGWVKVLDFGLARAGPGTGSPPSDLAIRAGITQAGTVLGTGPYMSPEQIENGPLDGRSDIFSLGVVMYEMILGYRPFRGDSWPALVAAVLKDDPAPVTTRRQELPEGVARIISDCLQKSPGDRPQAAQDVLSDLRTLRREFESETLSRVRNPESARRPKPASGPSPKSPRWEGVTSIAVLPLADLSASKDQGWLCEGLAEEILSALAQIDGLAVTPRDSAFLFGGTRDLGAIGAKLRVRTVLTGSVRQAGEYARISVELSDVVKGARVWSGRFDCEPADLVKVEGQIVKSVTEAFSLAARPDSDEFLATRARVNAAAHQMYLRGRAFLTRRGRLLFPALQHFQKAADLDPNCAPALAGIAEACVWLGYYGLVRPEHYRDRALASARRAVELDFRAAQAHAALAGALLLYRGDSKRAEVEYREAIRLNPRDSQIRCLHALFHLQLTHGRNDEAIAEVRKALSDDPYSNHVKTIYGLCLGIAGRHEQALPILRSVAAADPQALLARHGLARALYWAEHFEEAASALEGAGRMSGYSGFGAALLVAAWARQGRKNEARALLAQLDERSASEYISLASLAEASFALGDRAKAVALASRALGDREPQILLFARHAPHFAWLRKEPEWNGMLKHLDDLPSTES